jgi:hypothetical protein
MNCKRKLDAVAFDRAQTTKRDAGSFAAYDRAQTTKRDAGSFAAYREKASVYIFAASGQNIIIASQETTSVPSPPTSSTRM